MFENLRKSEDGDFLECRLHQSLEPVGMLHVNIKLEEEVTPCVLFNCSFHKNDLYLEVLKSYSGAKLDDIISTYKPHSD